MPMTWDAAADAKLLRAILETTNPKPSLDFEAIAQYMGSDCTAKAISHRLAKLKTIASDAPIRTTPKRAPRGTKSGGETGSAAKKRKIHKEEKEEQEEKKEIEEDEPDSPSVAAGKKLMQALLDNATEVNYDPMRWF